MKPVKAARGRGKLNPPDETGQHPVETETKAMTFLRACNEAKFNADKFGKAFNVFFDNEVESYVIGSVAVGPSGKYELVGSIAPGTEPQFTAKNLVTGLYYRLTKYGHATFDAELKDATVLNQTAAICVKSQWMHVGLMLAGQ